MSPVLGSRAQRILRLCIVIMCEGGGDIFARISRPLALVFAPHTARSRQKDRRDSASPRFAFQTEISAMGFGQATGERQAKACALRGCDEGIGEALEGFQTSL